MSGFFFFLNELFDRPISQAIHLIYNRLRLDGMGVPL
jgi:hypothetical protein